MHNDLIMKGDVVGYDTETTGVMPWGDFKRWGFFPSRPFRAFPPHAGGIWFFCSSHAAFLAVTFVVGVGAQYHCAPTSKWIK